MRLRTPGWRKRGDGGGCGPRRETDITASVWNYWCQREARAKSGPSTGRRRSDMTSSSATDGERREIVVNGRRVRVIDLHAHCSVPEAMAMMPNRPAGGGGGGPATPALQLANVDVRLKAMNEQGIDIEALSINPYWYAADVGLAE